MQRAWLLQATPCAGTRLALRTRKVTTAVQLQRPSRCSASLKQVVQQGAPAPASASALSRPAEGSSPLEVLAQRLFAASQPGDSRMMLLAAALVGAAALQTAAPGMAAAEDYHHHAQLLADVAEGADFWSNVLRYVSYFFSVLLGTAYVALKPLADLFKRPATAILGLAGIAGLLAFVSFTVNAMLGVNEPFEYNP